VTAFLTGSSQYGDYGTSESDIDLVVLVSHADKDKLIAAGDMPCRFGNLNLILTTDPVEYAFWMAAKQRCIVEGVTSKEEVIAIHDGMKQLLGLNEVDLEVSKRRADLIGEGEMESPQQRRREPSSYRRWGN
jgi:hypothetical protein